MVIIAQFENMNTNVTKHNIKATLVRIQSKDVKEKHTLLALLTRVVSALSHLSPLLSHNS